MKIHARLTMLLAVCWLAAIAAPARAVPEADLAKMTQAAPAKAQAEPKKQRKLLVLTTTKGFRHSSIGHGVAALRIMGEKTGAYTIEHTEDVTQLNADNLKRFDAVCFLNTTGELFEDEALKKSLSDFVKQGKGLIGIHAATDTFYKWSEYGEMMGGYFENHPWHEKVTLKIEDTDHACNACFEGRDRFEIVDEIYQFQAEPYSRQKLRILTSLDTNLTNMNKNGVKRTDGDFGVSWLRTYGEGRVFYCSLGHREEIYWNPTVLRHYLAGIQFAFGDLEADTTPSAEYDRTALVKHAEALLPAIMAYDFDKPREPLVRMNELAHKALTHEPARAAIEKQLIRVLESDASFAAKQFACRQLWVVGSDASAPVLEKMLRDEQYVDIARYALERNPSEVAGGHIVAALGAVDGNAAPRVLIGMIHSVAARRDSRALPVLLEFLDHKDNAVRIAAIGALGNIPGALARDALLKLPQNDPVVVDALLSHAELHATTHRTDLYRAIYQNAQTPQPQRIAALRGLLMTEPGTYVDELAKLLNGEDAHMAAVASSFISQLPGEDIGKTFAAKLPSLPTATQALVIGALAQRNEPSLIDTYVKYLTSDDGAVRLAALRALGQTDNAGKATAALARRAADATGAERNVARESLAQLRGPDVDANLIAVVKADHAGSRVEAMRSLASRGATAAVPTLVAALKDQDAAVRTAAFDALTTLGGPEQFDAVVQAMLSASDRGETRSAERTALMLARQMDASAATSRLIGAMSSASIPAKVSLVGVMSRLGGDDALNVVNAAAHDSNADLQLAGIRALAEWPDSAAIDPLMAIARETNNTTHRVLALRGVLRGLEMPSNRGSQATMALYRQTVELAKRDDEKKLVIAGLANQVDDEALKLAQAYLSDETVKAEAEQAVRKITAALQGPPIPSASHHSDRAGNALDGNPATRWDTGATMRPGMWFMLDLKGERLVRSITLDTTGSANDFPRGYEVYVSSTADGQGVKVASGKGENAVVKITLPQPTRGRFVKIVQTGSHDQWYWSIHELSIETE